ncbi:MAG: hypothetical protein HYZ28_12330 [Myxococcales bacterium]|nr:hypothetical protein [Myxococcales bacterium]
MRRTASRFDLLVLIGLLAGASAGADPPAIEVEPRSLVLGTGSLARVTVRHAGDLPLRATVSLGSLSSSPDPLAAVQTFTYTPPPIRYPQRALLVFWTEDEEELPEAAWVEIPLVGRLDLAVATEPSAAVRVELAGATFGPVKADAAGAATVSIEVPPGVTSAKVLAESRSKGSIREVAIEQPGPGPAAALLSPEPMHPDRGGWLWALHPDARAAEDISAEVAGGSLTARGALALGFAYALEPDPKSKVARVTVGLAREPKDNWTVVEARLSREVPIPIGKLGRMSLEASAGAATASGGLGFPVAIAAGFRLPPGRDRLSAELGGGYRALKLVSEDLTGKLESAVSAVPIELSLRARLARYGPYLAYARAGGGLVPFSHKTRSSSQPDYSESALGYDAFAALQVSRRFNALELFGELRGILLPLKASRLNGDGSGVALLVGARYALPIGR